MDRGAWQATLRVSQGVGHDRVTEPILYNGHSKKLTMLKYAIQWLLVQSQNYAAVIIVNIFY